MSFFNSCRLDGSVVGEEETDFWLVVGDQQAHEKEERGGRGGPCVVIVCAWIGSYSFDSREARGAAGSTAAAVACKFY